MSRKYLNPPLIEALCEFQFTGEAWDWTIPGLIYQEIQQDFPIKRQAPTIEFEIQTSASEINQRTKGGPGKMQFVRADETALVQVGPHLLAINHLRPYPHWSGFKPLILRMFDVYRRIAAPTGFKRVGVRYVNQIDIPEPEFELATYFEFGPRFPEPLCHHQMKSVFLRVDLLNESEVGHLLLTLGSAPQTLEKPASFILDLDFVTNPTVQVSPDGVEDWIEQAHNRIETAFEACLTDELRQIFDEVES